MRRWALIRALLWIGWLIALAVLSPDRNAQGAVLAVGLGTILAEPRLRPWVRWGVVGGVRLSSAAAQPLPASLSEVDTLSGIAFEQVVGTALTAIGWRVHTTPASGDFGADLVGVDAAATGYVVQCKRYRGSVGISAVQEVLGARQYYRTAGALVVTTGTFTAAARALAQRSQVTLWDRRGLYALLERARQPGASPTSGPAVTPAPEAVWSSLREETAWVRSAAPHPGGSRAARPVDPVGARQRAEARIEAEIQQREAARRGGEAPGAERPEPPRGPLEVEV